MYLAGKHANGLITKTEIPQTLERDTEIYESYIKYYEKFEELDVIKNEINCSMSGTPDVSESQVTSVNNEVSGTPDVSESQVTSVNNEVSGTPDVSESQVTRVNNNVSGTPDVMKNIVIRDVKDSGTPDVMKNIVNCGMKYSGNLDSLNSLLSKVNFEDFRNQYIFPNNLNSCIKCSEKTDILIQDFRCFGNPDLFKPQQDVCGCQGGGCPLCW